MIPSWSYAILVIAALVFLFNHRRMRREQRRKSLMTRPFPAEWEQILQQTTPLYKLLPQSLKPRLQGLIHVFLDEKTFVGCQDLTVTEEMRVTIAAQACVLLLHRPEHVYPTLRTIAIYPSTYSVKRLDDTGTHDRRAGESWSYGPVVLSWIHVSGGTSNVTDGYNVVLHEFAHQLDQESGAADGAPVLETRASCASWARVLSMEYKKLCADVEKHHPTVMDDYGATEPAEFFAVATETFFEKPLTMQRKYPELYAELTDYYKLDPAAWQ